MVVVAVIVKKMVNKSIAAVYFFWDHKEPRSRSLCSRRVWISRRGVPERTSGCPEVTQTGPTGANGGPHAHLDPRTGGFLFCHLGMTSPLSPWQQRACLAGTRPGSGAGVRH